MKTLVLVLVSAVFALAARAEVNVHALSQPGLPLEISSVSSDTSMMGKEANIIFKVTNHTGSNLTRLTTKILWLDENKKVLGGQLTTKIMDTPNDSSQMVQLRLEIQPAVSFDQGEFVLIVHEAASDNQVWKTTLSHQDLLKAMKGNKEVPMFESNKITQNLLASSQPCPGIRTAAFPQGGCGNDFCVECHIQAIDDCNGCLLSYSCNTTSCSCS